MIFPPSSIPPPSYDDAVTQETSKVSSSQRLPVLPTRVTGVAFVHGKFGKTIIL